MPILRLRVIGCTVSVGAVVRRVHSCLLGGCEAHLGLLDILWRLYGNQVRDKGLGELLLLDNRLSMRSLIPADLGAWFSCIITQMLIAGNWLAKTRVVCFFLVSSFDLKLWLI